MGRRPVPLPGEFARAVAKDIDWEMHRANLSQRSFAPEVEMSHSYLGDRIKNQYPFTIDDVDRIYSKLGIDPGRRLAKIEVRMLSGEDGDTNVTPIRAVGGDAEAFPIDEPYAANTDASLQSEEDQSP